jgi:hypothetical protein
MDVMTTENILRELLAERDRINGAIAALGGSGSGNGKGKAGRPKKDGSTRKPRTPEQRAAQGEKMKAYWAKKRKATKKANS